MTARRLMVIGLVLVSLLLLPSVAGASSKTFWVKNNASHKVGTVKQMGPTIDDWNYVYNSSGHKVGDGLPYAKLIQNMMFFPHGAGPWLAIGTKLYNDRNDQVGYTRKRSGTWAVYKKTAGGARQIGKVEGSARACQALMGVRCLLW